MLSRHLRDEVFVAGGQPTLTYVDREEQHIERNLARAIATPNQIVSLSGPTKTGKTVLCRRVLSERQYIWVDGGKIKTAEEFWEAVNADLQLPSQQSETSGSNDTVTGGMNAVVVSATGSHVWSKSQTKSYKLDTVGHSLQYLLEEKILLVIDDFHYIPPEARKDIVRTIKGAVFNGLKVILLSVSHRVFDVIKAESELTGRFVSVTLPNWELSDLQKIPLLGFKALNVSCPKTILNELCSEAQENPFLMQKFCWEICYDCNVEQTALLTSHKIPANFDLKSMFIRLAKDSGLPIYQKLAAGPQSRRVRAKRPMRTGGEADIYEATLKAIAATGPKAKVSYDEIKTSLNAILTDQVPQKHEVTGALKHLTIISRKIEAESAIDWDDDNREVTVADPYLRFYLRWQVRELEPH